jgi:hypothetical protein
VPPADPDLVSAAASGPNPPPALPTNAEPPYAWRQGWEAASSLAARIPTPEGFVRDELAPGSFGFWLRHLPLVKGRPQLLLHDGRRKANQEAHHSIVDIDVGQRDLQQCADAVMRLRAEYLFAAQRGNDIHFNYTSGDRIDWARWAMGERPQVQGREVAWQARARADSSHANFRRYLENVFTYAGTHSLGRELKPVADPEGLAVGDVFIQGGFPGHAVLVVDRATDPRGGSVVFLLVQSYMPAQQIHVLRNPSKELEDPWYDLDFGETLVTPEWTFRAADLHRFP